MKSRKDIEKENYLKIKEFEKQKEKLLSDLQATAVL